MTLGIIEGVLCMAMVGLIWVMLDIFAGNHHADDKRQEAVSPDYYNRMHQPVLPSPASPAYAGNHGCQAVEECAAGVLRSLGEGGHASAGFAEDTRGTTAVKPWGSTELIVTVSLPVALIERLRNAAHWTGDRPLVDLVAEAIEDIVTQMEEINGETFPQHVSPLKQEAMTERALSGPLR
jgi:hypothetical protein